MNNETIKIKPMNIAHILFTTAYQPHKMSKLHGLSFLNKKAIHGIKYLLKLLI